MPPYQVDTRLITSAGSVTDLFAKKKPLSLFSFGVRRPIKKMASRYKAIKICGNEYGI
jgi:hypothetical protein